MIRKIYENIKGYLTRNIVNESMQEDIVMENHYDESWLGVDAMMIPPGETLGLEKEIEDETRKV